MTKIDLTRRDFLIAGAGAAAGFITASLIGCSSGGNSGGIAGNSSNTGVQDSSYEGQRGITAFYLTTNSSLYRQILPTAFDMPDNLAVVVTVVFYYNVTAPLVPYHEGYVMLMCKYQGQDCLYTVTMPVDDQYACDGGRQLGFPKYMADRIELTNNGGLWDGRVIYQGRTILQMNFTPSGDATVYDTDEPGRSSVNLVPPGSGPQVLAVNLAGHQHVTSIPGSATITADPSETWSPLLDGAALISAQQAEITGSWKMTWGTNLKTSPVSIARIKNNRIDLAVEEAIALLGGISAVTAGKQKIMLKPNLVTEDPRSTTNPEVVRALATLMQSAGKEVLIGEGSACATGFNLKDGVVYRTKNTAILDGMQQYVFDSLGYTSLAGSMSIPLINLHTGDMVTVPVPNSFVYDNISLHHTLTEIDMLCSVPMMKTHNLSGVTLGMKNLIGTYPGAVYGSVRYLVHEDGADVESSGAAATVVDMVRANKLGLVVIDASTAMEGEGPSGGELVKMDLIIAGTNPLATDMVAANIMGFSPDEIPTFVWANRAGMAPQNLNQIEIRGESIGDVKRNFARPSIYSWNLVRDSFGEQEI